MILPPELENPLENPFERPDEAKVNLHPVNPLSWDLEHINDQVAPVGWKRIPSLVVLRVFLFVLYALVYGMTFASVKFYYKWPLEEADTAGNTTRNMLGSIVIELEAFLLEKDENEFECNGTMYYLNETGPLYDFYNASEIRYDEGYFGGVLKEGGFIWGFALFFFTAFILVKLYFGKYNQLLGLVKFQRDESDGALKPKNYSFAFVIMCNAKSFYNIVFKEQCDRLVALSENNTDTASFIMAMIYFFGMLCSLLWIMTWLMTCNLCCMKQKHFMWFRRFMFFNAAYNLIIWITSINIELDFNPDMPLLFAANAVSWCDLLVSIGFDVYLGCQRATKCCGKSGGETDVEPDHTETHSSSTRVLELPSQQQIPSVPGNDDGSVLYA